MTNEMHTSDGKSALEQGIIRDNTNYDFKMAKLHAEQARRGLVEHGCEIQAATMQEIISELDEQHKLFVAQYGTSENG